VGHVLVLTHRQVWDLLPMAEAIAVVERVFEDVARGEAHQPLRSVIRPPQSPGLMAMMPSYATGSFGLKAVCVFAGNSQRGIDPHQGAVLVFSGETGELQAVVDASAVTAIRTPAVSALAARLLANPEAGDLGVLGAGRQGEGHIRAFAVVRPIRRLRIYDLVPERAHDLAARMHRELGVPAEAVVTAQDAVEGADLVVTVTSSREPVLRGAWLQQGAHVSAVGASTPLERELDVDAVARSILFADRRESIESESADYLEAIRAGAVLPGHVRAELADVVVGRDPGRTRSDEITLFKSLGLAVEDLAAARYVFEKAMTAGVGTWVRDFA
jgi:ornithine cyclodeaminase